MSRRPACRTISVLGVCLAASLLLTQAGCLGLMSNLMHAVGADMIPAEYEGLAESRVAVVTVTERSRYSQDISARLLSRKVAGTLLTKIDEIDLVREDKVQQWRDTNGWDNFDYVAIGQGVEADQVVAIELNDLTLREGPTLFRGSAEVKVSVIEVSTGKELYRHTIDEFRFPQTAGQYTSETTESKFRKLYLTMLSERIGRLFHPYDFSETVALDGAIASQ